MEKRKKKEQYFISNSPLIRALFLGGKVEQGSVERTNNNLKFSKQKLIWAILNTILSAYLICTIVQNKLSVIKINQIIESAVSVEMSLCHLKNDTYARCFVQPDSSSEECKK